MGQHFKEEDLKNLTSSIKYDKFENTQDPCKGVYWYSEIKDAFDMYPKVNDISQKLEKALCFMYNRKKYHHIRIDDEFCSYFYYWVGHNILEHLRNRSYFSKIIQMIYEELNRSDKGTICKPLYDNIDENTFRKYKLLFDYSIDDYHIKLNTVNPDTTCDEHYIEAINKYLNTYNDVYLSCDVNKEKKYDCDYFHKLFKKDEYKKLHPFYCTKYDAQRFSTEAQSGIETGKRPLVESPNSKGNHDLVTKPYQQVNSNQKRSQLTLENHTFTEQHRLDTRAPIPTDEIAESGPSKTIAGSVAPVLGVSSISLLLYKVTPVAGYINRLLGRNRNAYNALEDMESLNPYSEGMDPLGRRMNISYHRL